MDFNFYKWENGQDYVQEHPKISNYMNSSYCILFSLRNEEIGTEKDWRLDYWDWESCVELEYEIVDFWYENGTYYHILRKYDCKNFSDDDFHIIQEEIFSTSGEIPIIEVNILLFK